MKKQQKSERFQTKEKATNLPKHFQQEILCCSVILRGWVGCLQSVLKQNLEIVTPKPLE
jgi:hypothetical protein